MARSARRWPSRWPPASGSASVPTTRWPSRASPAPAAAAPEKPVGTTWLALAGPDGVQAACYRFTGDRQRNRLLAVASALDMLRRDLVGAPVVDPDRLTWAVRG